jgi:lysyl-tRNA synthetase class 2
MPTITDLRKTRIDKLQKLQKMGTDPFPSRTVRDHTIAQARTKEGEDVAIVGRMTGMRGHGKIYFFDLQDESGHIQVACKKDLLPPETFQLLELFDLGDFLAVQGEVGKTQAGEITVFVKDVQILTKAIRPLPDKWYGLKDVEERYRKRYLDTILNEEVRHIFVMRTQIIDAIRDFLTNRGFLEVETPTLQPIYGGGLARPFVTHHNELEADFYLRISDEMYLKRLIIGGFEKVFEITKVFRNEGVDHDHNPEFTMFEAQIAYQDYSYGMDIIEEIIEFTAHRVLGKTQFFYQGQKMDVKRPWPRYRMVEAIQKFTGANPMDWKSVEEAKKSIQKMNIPEEKIGQLKSVHKPGECIAFAFEEAVESQLIQPTIIYDYPIEVSPLAKKCEDPRFTQRFEMFAFGSELGNNYSELNDPIELQKRFVEEKKREAAGFKEAHQTDENYLEAIEHGFPPTCGIAIGIDRLVMLLTDAKSIKEVIPFPTLRQISVTE